MPKAARTNKQNQLLQLPNQGKGRGGGKQQAGGSGGSVGSGKGDQWSTGKTTDDGGGLQCPLCIEPLDDTERKFYPCPCGYQVCLFCLDKLRTECNKMCPGCRQTYDEDPSVNHPPPKPDPNAAKQEHRTTGRVRPLSIPIYSKTSEHAARHQRSPLNNHAPAAAPAPTPFIKPTPVSNGNVNNSPLVQSPASEHRVNSHVEHRVHEFQREQKSSRTEPNKINTDLLEKQGGNSSWMPQSRGRGQEQEQGQPTSPKQVRSQPQEPPAPAPTPQQPPQPKPQPQLQVQPKPTPVKDPNVSNFLSMLRNQSDRNNEIKISDIKLDGNMAAIPPPPGFGGPPGFTTPNWSKPMESQPIQPPSPSQPPQPLLVQSQITPTSNPELSINTGLGLGVGTSSGWGLGVGASSGLGLEKLIASETDTPVFQDPVRFNHNPLGVIGSSRNNGINNQFNLNQQAVFNTVDSNWDVSNKQFQGLRDSNSNLNQSALGTGSILNQLQALWKDDADNSNLGAFAPTPNPTHNTNTNNNNNSSLFSGSLWNPTPLNANPTPLNANPNPLNSNPQLWQQPQTIQNGLNFGLDLGLKMQNQAPQNKNPQSLLLGLQNQRNGHRQQQYPQSLLNSSQINPNQLNAALNQSNINLNNNNALFMNQSLLDNSSNNNSLLQGTQNQGTQNQNIQNQNQFSGGLGLGGVQSGGVLQQNQQQTHDLQMLLQQLQQGGGTRSTRSGGNNVGGSGGGLFSNFPGGV